MPLNAEHENESRDGLHGDPGLGGFLPAAIGRSAPRLLLAATLASLCQGSSVPVAACDGEQAIDLGDRGDHARRLLDRTHHEGEGTEAASRRDLIDHETDGAEPPRRRRRPGGGADARAARSERAPHATASAPSPSVDAATGPSAPTAHGSATTTAPRAQHRRNRPVVAVSRTRRSLGSVRRQGGAHGRDDDGP